MHKPNSQTNQSAEEQFGPELPAEKKFDQAVYGGISYAAQAGTGILLSHSIKHGRLHQPFINLAEKITGKPQNGKINTTMVIAIMVMVGNAFLLPVKWLENRRPQILRWMTEKENAKAEAAGHPVSDEERMQQEKRLHCIENKPKQNWWSLGGGRAFALGAVFAIDYLIGEKRNAWMQNKTTELAQAGMKLAGLKKLGQNETLANYMRIGFVDSFYSAVSAGGLYIYSHFIKPPKEDYIEKLPPFDEQAAKQRIAECKQEESSGKKWRADVAQTASPKAIMPKEKPSKPAAEYIQKLASENLSPGIAAGMS